MTDTLHDQPVDGELMIVWDEEAHAAWLEKWAPPLVGRLLAVLRDA